MLCHENLYKFCLLQLQLSNQTLSPKPTTKNLSAINLVSEKFQLQQSKPCDYAPPPPFAPLHLPTCTPHRYANEAYSPYECHICYGQLVPMTTRTHDSLYPGQPVPHTTQAKSHPIQLFSGDPIVCYKTHKYVVLGFGVVISCASES